MDSFILVKDEDVKSVMLDDIAQIIKKEYGKNITTMDKKELDKFIKSIIIKKSNLTKQIVWWLTIQCARNIGLSWFLSFKWNKS